VTRGLKLQQWALVFGLCVAAVLLVRFALDLTAEADLYLAVPFWLLVFTSLSVPAAALLRPNGGGSTAAPGRWSGLLLAAIPLGFVSSSLDCTGLSAQGCSRFCTFVKVVWIPLIAITALATYLTVARGQPNKAGENDRRYRVGTALGLALTAMSFLPLLPHCVCYNAGNGWWIDRLGASPTCYAWGFATSLVALSALSRGKLTRLSALVCAAIITGGMAFFIGHHYFRFPW